MGLLQSSNQIREPLAKERKK
jgi:hypothetical protein